MRTPARLLLQFTVCAVLASSAFAQSPGAASPAAAPGQKPLISEARINVQFDGLKLEDAMEIVRAQIPDLNIVVPPSLASTPIGPLKLRNVTVEGLVRAIASATDGSVLGQFDGEDYLSFSPDDSAPRQESVCRVLSLREYLAGKNPNEIDRAIADLNEVVAMARDQLEHARKGATLTAPQFSVHPATKLLIVVGSPEAVAIVEEVINAVSGVPSSVAAPGAGMPGGMGAGGGYAPNIPANAFGGRGLFGAPGAGNQGGGAKQGLQRH